MTTVTMMGWSGSWHVINVLFPVYICLVTRYYTPHNIIHDTTVLLHPFIDISYRGPTTKLVHVHLTIFNPDFL